jgi:DNA polymerase III subunit epsilon
VILFFDTETTGLPVRGGDLDQQPHLVQLAAVLMDDQGRERCSLSTLIKPEGWTIPAEAAAIHGITTEDAERFGVPLKAALSVFFGWSQAAAHRVAHNAAFDVGVMMNAAMRTWGKQPEKLPAFCTMRAATPIVNLPPTGRMLAAGFNRPKAPKLEECIRHFFGEALEGAHDALVDVRACARVFFKLCELGAGPRLEQAA